MNDPAFGFAVGVSIALAILLYLHRRLMRRVDNLERITAVSIPSVFEVTPPPPSPNGMWTYMEATPLSPRQRMRKKNKANRQKFGGGK
jgi:hypothetical protein